MSAVLTVEQVAVLPTPFDRDPDYEERKKYSGWSVPYGGNRALAGAYRKGALAAVEGKGLAACPYDDARTDRGSVTFSRAFIRAWGVGWHHGMYGDRHACTISYPCHDGPCRLREAVA